MRPENERRLSWQMGFLLFFWGIAIFTFITQMFHLPPAPLDLIEKLTLEMFPPNPYTYYPLEYNPFNSRMTLVESCVIWIFFFYGNLRLYNIFRIFSEDDKDCLWENFWKICEKT